MLWKKREKCKLLRFENATLHYYFSKLISVFLPPTFIVLTRRTMQQRS